VVVVGFNHHFGFNKEGDYRHLWGWREKYNFEAEEIPEQEVQHETVSSTRIRKAISEGYIQRANAYLDHYYMIIGKPEVHSFKALPVLPSFLKIPITEECKILPATGIYAVSVLTDQYNTKGMAVILQETGKASEVLIHVFENEDKYEGKTVSVLFQKMIRGSINLSDPKIQTRLNDAKAEISELIY
jgi:riboflavin kinase/FMN adenylyltransferase